MNETKKSTKKSFLAPAKRDGNAPLTATDQTFKPQFAKKVKKKTVLTQTTKEKASTDTTEGCSNPKHSEAEKDKKVTNRGSKSKDFVPLTRSKGKPGSNPPKSLTDDEYKSIFESVLNPLESEDIDIDQGADNTGEKTTTCCAKDGNEKNISDVILCKGKPGSDKKNTKGKATKSMTEDKYEQLFNDVISRKDNQEVEPVVSKNKHKQARRKSLADDKVCDDFSGDTQSYADNEESHEFTDKLSQTKIRSKKHKKATTCTKQPQATKDCEHESEKEEEVEAEKGTWIQCTKNLCGKWRYVAGIQDPSTVRDDWECCMNSDEEYNSCEKPEMSFDESDHIFTKYVAGSIVWAKMDGYQWWPAMIDYDPDFEIYVKIASEKSMVPIQFHVTFFDDHVSRAWIRARCICPYVTGKGPQINGRGLKKGLQKAASNAEKARGMDLESRIRRFGFSSRFSGKVKSAREDRFSAKLKKKFQKEHFKTELERDGNISLKGAVSDESLSDLSFEEETEYLPVESKSRRKKHTDEKETFQWKNASPQTKEVSESDEDSERDNSEHEKEEEKGSSTTVSKQQRDFTFDSNIFTMDLHSESKNENQKDIDVDDDSTHSLIENESEIDDWDEKAIEDNRRRVTQANIDNSSEQCNLKIYTEDKERLKKCPTVKEKRQKSVKPKKIPKGNFYTGTVENVDEEDCESVSSNRGLSAKCFEDIDPSKTKTQKKTPKKMKKEKDVHTVTKSKNPHRKEPSISDDSVMVEKSDKVPEKICKTTTKKCALSDDPKTTSEEKSAKRKGARSDLKQKNKARKFEYDVNCDTASNKMNVSEQDKSLTNQNKEVIESFEDFVANNQVVRDPYSGHNENWDSDKENIEPRHKVTHRKQKRNKSSRSDVDEAHSSETKKKAKKRLFADETVDNGKTEKCSTLGVKNDDSKKKLDFKKHSYFDDVKKNGDDEKSPPKKQSNELILKKKKKSQFTPLNSKKDGEVPSIKSESKENLKPDKGHLPQITTNKLDLHVVPDIENQDINEISSDTNLLQKNQDSLRAHNDIVMPPKNTCLEHSDDDEEEELELNVDDKYDSLKLTPDNDRATIDINKAGQHDLPPQNIFNSDDSGDESDALVFEEDKGNKILKSPEKYGRFGGRCFEHGSDTDPLELIED